MLLFCPSCSNVLTVSQVSPSPSGTFSSMGPPPHPGSSSSSSSSSSSPPATNHPTGPINRLECLSCPYQFLLTKRYFERKYFVRQEREDVFGGPGAWDNAQKQMGVQCPNQSCEGTEAAYFQVQIRSADEPMTSFYKCMTCGHRWREN